MKEVITKLLEKASVNSVEKKASHIIFGEREIPKAILDEIKSKKNK